MSEAKFTKGEWSIKAIENDKEYIKIRGTLLGGKFKIANVTDLKFHHDDGAEWCEREREESMANAHLIAAAPEMYKMLEEILYNGDLPSVVDSRIVNLLSEARGEK